MLRPRTRRERQLKAAAVIAAVLFVADIIVLNIVGEIPSSLWIVAVPVGLFLVPLVAVACLLLLLLERQGP